MTPPEFDNPPQRSSKLGHLPRPQRDVIYTYCDTSTLKEATAWLKSTYNIQISISNLSVWLRRETRNREVEYLLSGSPKAKTTSEHPE